MYIITQLSTTSIAVAKMFTIIFKKKKKKFRDPLKFFSAGLKEPRSATAAWSIRNTVVRIVADIIEWTVDWAQREKHGTST